MPDFVDQYGAAHSPLIKLRCLVTGICNSEPTLVVERTCKRKIET
jgi:hypothetical protein